MFFDTNILIDYLYGLPQARAEIQRAENPRISIIVWLEVMVGVSDADEDTVRRFLSYFEVVSITPPVSELAVRIRRTKKLRLPDCIVLATAKEFGAVLVTRNTKDCDKSDRSIRVPYRLMK